MTDHLSAYPVIGDPRSLTLLDVNARYMTPAQYADLVRNVKRDGCLTSTPLVWNDQETGRLVVLSGNHRTKASIDAGIAEIAWLQVDQPLPRQRQIAVQLSHNSITGQDDPAILKELWEEIESIDWREYAALDDKTLDLLEKVDLASIGEPALDYSTVQIMFLPHEVERSLAAFEEIRDMFPSVDQRWVAADKEWGRLVDAIDSARGAADVVNTGAAFTVLLDVVETNLGALREHWYDDTDGTTRHDKWVPLETLIGTRRMPADAAAIVAQAMDKAKRDAEIGDDQPTWRLLELLAADYLGGA